MTGPFELEFDMSALAALDEFALLARQDYNLGNRGSWFTHSSGAVRMQCSIASTAWAPTTQLFTDGPGSRGAKRLSTT